MENVNELSKIYYRFKFILLGDVAVGKTCIANKFVKNEFEDKYVCTVGVEFKVKTLNLSTTTLADLQVWDTCGQEKFRTLTRQYYRDANGIILVFDLTSTKSFTEIESWLEEIKTNFPTKNEVSILLIGNKSDLISERKLNFIDVTKFANKHSLEYVEVSAKDGTNIITAFEKLTWMVIHKEEDKSKTNNSSTPLPKLTQSMKYYLPAKEDKKEKKKNCC